MGRGWVDWWIRDEFQKDPEWRWRARFLVHVSLLGIGISMAMGSFYVVTWVPLLLLQCASVVVALLIGLLTFKQRGTFLFSSHLAMASVLVAFAVPLLIERDFDPSGLAWFSVIPFVAALLLGARVASYWMLICGLAIVLLYVHPRSWGFIELAPHVALVRNLMLLVTILMFALSFQSRQREVRRELERANRAKSSFLANMSHELRTPMNAVLGMTQVLLEGNLSPLVREQLGLVNRSGAAMVQLVNGILDLSRVEAGKLQVEVADFSLAALLDDLDGLYHLVAAQKRLEWRVLKEGLTVPQVKGDALRLRQVLCNLVDKALKFTARGAVTLRVRRDGERVLFAVSDTGPGVSAEASARIFQAFEQEDVSTTRRHGGSGLGLALSARLVALQGGELVLENAGSPGATFSFSLPLPEGQGVEAPAAAVSPAPWGHGRVLVVDDNPINLRVACALVAARGFAVTSATDGQAAVERATAEAFDLVLMDCHMPVMNGLDATRALRALPGRRVPIVALTAAALPEELVACREAGMDDCLTKPLQLSALEAVLRRYLPPR